MKQNDIAMLILIVSISLVASYFLGNALFRGESTRNVMVEVVEPISTEFEQPSADIFNDESVNPARTIIITPNNTANPFEN